MAGRGVLVTGGSSGLGAAMVRRFALGGDRVWFTYRSHPDAAARLVAEVAEAGGKAEAFELDQGDAGSHRRLLERVHGPVDVLVNNAAVGTKTVENCVDGPVEQRDEAFLRVNSVGPLWMIRALLPAMLERGYGKIVNVCSVGGGIATFPAFDIADGMSKAALAYLTRHLAAQLVHDPVHVFAICPGATHTPMLRASLLDALNAAQLAELTSRLPGGRLLDPAELAELTWWLCEEPAALLHGAVLDASRGLGVHPGLVTGPETVC